MSNLSFISQNEMLDQSFARDFTLEEVEMVEGGASPVAWIVGGGLAATFMAGSSYSQERGCQFSGSQAADAWKSTMQVF